MKNGPYSNKVRNESASGLDTSNVKVRFNKSLTFTVDNTKLKEKSAYFQIIKKPCFIDKKSEYLDVNFTVSNNDFFEKVINYITIGKIKLDNENLLDVQSLATYLQIDNLQKNCLNYFIYNLNLRTIDNQFILLENYPMVDKVYKERTMALKERCLPSFSGLYFVNARKHTCDANLKMFCLGTKSLHIVICLDIKINDTFNKKLVKMSVYKIR